MAPALTIPPPVLAADEPAWLADLRAAAARRLSDLERPTTELEEWRYSRVDELEVEGRALAPRPEVGDDLVAAWRAETGVGDDAAAATAVEVDGHVVSIVLGDAARAAGVRLDTAGRLGADAALTAALGAAGVDAFAELVAAVGPDPLVLVVPRGVVVDGPVVVRSVVRDGAHLVASRFVVVAGDDSEVSVLRWSGGTPDVVDLDAPAPLVLDRVDVVVGAAARISLTTVQDDAVTVDRVANLAAVVDRDATLRLHHAALGGRAARARFDCRLEGRGATGDLAALYLGHDDQAHDLRTFQEHLAPDTTSHLVFKGALDDRARAVYTGLIRVGESARGTNAEQSNRLVKLSEDTWAESVPNLEIHNNDVRCAHASTVGPIDEAQRFYLESRGVAPEVAERLVVAGFFEEVLEGFAHPGAAERVRRIVAARLGGEGRS